MTFASSAPVDETTVCNRWKRCWLKPALGLLIAAALFFYDRRNCSGVVECRRVGSVFESVFGRFKRVVFQKLCIIEFVDHIVGVNHVSVDVFTFHK
jgi:hypothetical protein